MQITLKHLSTVAVVALGLSSVNTRAMDAQVAVKLSGVAALGAGALKLGEWAFGSSEETVLRAGDISDTQASDASLVQNLVRLADPARQRAAALLLVQGVDEKVAIDKEKGLSPRSAGRRLALLSPVAAPVDAEGKETKGGAGDKPRDLSKVTQAEIAEAMKIVAQDLMVEPTKSKIETQLKAIEDALPLLREEGKIRSNKAQQKAALNTIIAHAGALDAEVLALLKQAGTTKAGLHD